MRLSASVMIRAISVACFVAGCGLKASEYSHGTCVPGAGNTERINVPATPTSSSRAWPLFPSTVANYGPITFHTKINVVTDGDSLTGQPGAPYYDGGAAGPATWVPLAAMLAGTDFKVTNVARGGTTCALLRATAGGRVDALYDPSKGVNIIVIQCGINDIVGFKYDAGPNDVDPAIDALEGYARDRHAAHPWRVIVIGPTPSNYFNPGGYEHFASRIRNECLTFADQCVNIEADVNLGSPHSYADLRWYSDNTHKTPNGDVRYAMLVLPAIVDQASHTLDAGR